MISKPIVRRSCFLKSACTWILALAAVVTFVTSSQAQSYGAPTDIDAVRYGAEKGDPAMQRVLALRYLNGEGVPKSEVEAVRWLKSAGEKGDAQAQFMMANFHEEGRGVPKDMRESIRWYRMAAEQGVLNAQFNLGDSYFRGFGVPKDVNEAMKWFRMAAAQDDPDAKARIGVAYLTGEGLPLNYQEAATYLRASSYGLGPSELRPLAQYHLGTMYRDGLGMEQDDEAAGKWFKQSAQGGYADGMYAYARTLIDGKGIYGTDPVTGREWMQRAAAKGHVAAKNYMATINRSQGDSNTRTFGEFGAGPTSDRQGNTTTFEEIGAALTSDRQSKTTMSEEAKDELGSNKPGGEPEEFTKLTKAGADAITGFFSGAAKKTEEVISGFGDDKKQGASGKPSFVNSSGTSSKGDFNNFSVSPPGAAKIPSNFSSGPSFSTEPKKADEGFASFGTESAKKTETKSSFGSGNMGSLDAELAKLKAKNSGADGEKSGFGSSFGNTHSGESSFSGGPTGDRSSFGSKPGEDTGKFGSSPAFASNTEEEKPAFAGGGAAEVAGDTPRAFDEPRVEYRDSGAGFPVGIAYITLAMATAMVFISLMFFFTFKTRVHSLESEIKKAQFELSKANVNLSSMMHQVEQLALQAPGEEESGQGIVSLPDWGGEKPQPGEKAEGFKISRPR